MNPTIEEATTTYNSKRARLVRTEERIIEIRIAVAEGFRLPIQEQDHVVAGEGDGSGNGNDGDES